MSGRNDMAFPGESVDVNGIARNHPGMSLRDYLAGQAIVGIMTNASGTIPPFSVLEAWSRLSYQVSDAILAERNKK